MILQEKAKFEKEVARLRAREASLTQQLQQAIVDVEVPVDFEEMSFLPPPPPPRVWPRILLALVLVGLLALVAHFGWHRPFEALPRCEVRGPNILGRPRSPNIRKRPRKPPAESLRSLEKTQKGLQACQGGKKALVFLQGIVLSCKAVAPAVALGEPDCDECTRRTADCRFGLIGLSPGAPAGALNMKLLWNTTFAKREGINQDVKCTSKPKCYTCLLSHIAHKGAFVLRAGPYQVGFASPGALTTSRHGKRLSKIRPAIPCDFQAAVTFVLSHIGISDRSLGLPVSDLELPGPCEVRSLLGCE